MILNEVMALEGRELNCAVAECLGWRSVVPHIGTAFPPGTTDFSVHNLVGIPRFSTDWAAAMQVRAWVLKQGVDCRAQWVHALLECLYARLGSMAVDLVLDTEPVDYARAVLMVEVQP